MASVITLTAPSAAHPAPVAANPNPPLPPPFVPRRFLASSTSAEAMASPPLMPSFRAPPPADAQAGPGYPTYSFRENAPHATIRYITDLAAADAALAELDLQGPLGFDLEWRPTFIKGAPENPVALVQLADAATDSVLLFQVSAMPNFPANLADVLGNPSIIKCGVGIQNDVLKLYRDWNVSTRGCVDLSLLARSVDAQWKGRYANSLGLARLVEMYKHRTLAKGKRIQMSDWSRLLNPIQQEYAANDAHAGLALYQHLFSLAQRKIPVPKPVYYSFWCEDGLLLVPDGAEGECPPPPPPVLSSNDDSSTSPSLSSSESTASSSAPSSVIGPETPVGSPDFSAAWPGQEPVRALWYPYNPEYDPGPPPPPRPPKPPKPPVEDDVGELEMSFDAGTPSALATPTPPRGSGGAPRGRRGGHSRRQSSGRATPFFSNALPIHPRGSGRPNTAHAPASAPAAPSPLASPPMGQAARGRGPRGRWSPSPAFVPQEPQQPHNYHQPRQQQPHVPPQRPWTAKSGGSWQRGPRPDAVRTQSAT